MNEEQQLELDLQAKSLDAPRISPEILDDAIEQALVDYYVVPGTTTTVCCVTLNSGYTLIGKSACVSVDNFNEEIGRRIALRDAREQLWSLLGFALAIGHYTVGERV